MAAIGETLLEMRDITKEFPGVKALKGVQLEVKAGEVHALMGENGAGKSTLMKCIIGIHPQTSGQIIFDGKDVGKIRSTKGALAMGISMVHQELSPVEHRNVMENLWLGREPKNALGLIDHKKMYKMSKELLAQVGLTDLDPRTLMRELTVAKMQMIEIAKAVSHNCKLLILDEPTSALTNREVDELFEIVKKMKESGIGIVYITHKMDELYRIADRITVYRDGQYIGTENVANITMDKVISMMVGRDIKDMYPKVPCEIGEVKLEVKGLTHPGLFENVSFTARKGEILGMAGLVGAGRTEVAETIFGMHSYTAGKILIDGKEVHIKSPKQAIKSGISLLTEDRRGNGILSVQSVKDNIAVANLEAFKTKSGLLSMRNLDNVAQSYVDTLEIKTPSLTQKIENLSGGNQQKVLIARWLFTNPDILFVDEPTRGIDVGAKAEIYKLLTKLAGEGKTIIMISSELPEILGMSDRVVVMHEGRVTGILDNDGLTQEEVMKYAIA